MWFEKLKRMQMAIPPKPAMVQIELNNACNLDCTMCPRHELPIELQEMDWDTYVQVLNQLDSFGLHRIDLGGWGEITYHKQFNEMIEFACKRGFHVSFTTNGLLLRKEKLQRVLDAGVREITFSLDSLEKRSKGFEGHINNTAWKNLQELLSHREQYKLIIRVNTLVQKSNFHEIIEITDRLDELGVYMHVLFGPNKARDHENLRLDFEQEVQLYSQIEEFRSQDRWKMIVTTPPGRYRKGSRSLNFKLNEHCPQTFESMYINRKGQVTPCTLLPDHHFGHLKDHESLQSLWKGCGFKDFRRNQKSVCDGCDALKFEEH